MTPDNKRIDKLLSRIQVLLDNYLLHRTDYVMHRCIDQYYYIQKMEELRLMHDAFLKSRLNHDLLLIHYREIYCRWRTDVRWLNKRLLFEVPCLKSFPYIPVL